MRYLSIVFASLLLVGCSTSTEVDNVDATTEEQVTEFDSTEAHDSEASAEEVEEQPSEETEPVEVEATDPEETVEQEIEPESSSSESSASTEQQPEPTEQPASEEPANEPEQEEVVEEPVEEEPSGYTMAMVMENDDANSCWSVINGNVYDLTSWINSHPGGSQRILSLCGTDGSASFNSMHQGQSNPESRLQSFLLGPLS